MSTTVWITLVATLSGAVMVLGSFIGILWIEAANYNRDFDTEINPAFLSWLVPIGTILFVGGLICLFYAIAISVLT